MYKDHCNTLREIYLEISAVKLDKPEDSQFMETEETNLYIHSTHVLLRKAYFSQVFTVCLCPCCLRLREEKCGEEMGFVTLDP